MKSNSKPVVIPVVMPEIKQKKEEIKQYLEKLKMLCQNVDDKRILKSTNMNVCST